MIRERFVWIDILNIVACICVVWMHCTNNPMHIYTGEIDVRFFIGAITHSIAYWPVPVFFMLSGCNLIGYNRGWKKFFKKRIYKTGLPFVIWSFFYFVVNYHEILPAHSFVELFLWGKFSPTMWFFIPLFSLYISMPILSAFVRNASQRVLQYYVIMGFVFISIIPQIFDLLNWKYPNMFPFGLNFIYVAVVGYLLKKENFSNKHVKLLYLLGGIACILHFIILLGFATILKRSPSIFLHCTYPLNLLISMAVFIFFKRTEWETILSKVRISHKAIALVSSSSLGVFLLHPFFITISLYFNLYLANPFWGFLTIYFISLLTVVLLKRIPLIRMIVP